MFAAVCNLGTSIYDAITHAGPADTQMCLSCCLYEFFFVCVCFTLAYSCLAVLSYSDLFIFLSILLYCIIPRMLVSFKEREKMYGSRWKKGGEKLGQEDERQS